MKLRGKRVGKRARGSGIGSEWAAEWERKMGREWVRGPWLVVRRGEREVITLATLTRRWPDSSSTHTHPHPHASLPLLLRSITSSFSLSLSFSLSFIRLWLASSHPTLIHPPPFWNPPLITLSSFLSLTRIIWNVLSSSFTLFFPLAIGTVHPSSLLDHRTRATSVIRFVPHQ